MIVADDKDTGVLLAGDFGEEFHHLAAALAVERGGGFVGEDEVGLVRERTGHGDALLLAAGERDGQILCSWTDVEVVEQLHGAASGLAWAGVVHFEGDLHISQSGEERDEVRFLKHKAQVLAAGKRGQANGVRQTGSGCNWLTKGWPSSFWFWGMSFS